MGSSNNIGTSIHERFEAEVELRPDALALVTGSSALTYRTLNWRANQLARHLVSLGVGPDVPVPLCAEQPLEALIGMLGVLKAGGAYVPMLPTAPGEALARMIDQARMPVILTESAHRASLRSNASIVCLDDVPPVTVERDDTNLEIRIMPEGLAYIVYDRISSAKAAGIRVTHGDAVRDAMAEGAPELTRADLLLIAAPPSSRAASFLIWRCLLRGAGLALMEASELSLEDIGRLIQKHRVTAMYLPHERIHAALEDLPSIFRDLRLLITDGPLQSAEARRALGPLGMERLVFHESARSPDAPTIGRAPRDSVIPLSYMQEQFWILAQLDPSLPHYNFLWTIDTPPGLDAGALDRSVNELIQRHEALRTTFTTNNDQPVQVIHPPSERRLHVMNVEGLSPDEQAAEIHRIATTALRQPFDLALGPLIRVILVQVGGQRYKLLVCAHHIIIDGYSAYDVLFPELIALVEAFSAGEAPSLPGVNLHMADYAAWQRRRIQGDVLKDHLRYWKARLEGLPAGLGLLTDRPRPAVPSARGDVCSVLLPGALVDSLRALARRERATLFTVMLSAFYTLLHRYTSQEDIVLGTVIADRDTPEKRAIFGPLLNTVVLRAKVRADLAFPELTRHVYEVLRGARAYGELPFEILVNELRPERIAGHNPLFQVAFNRRPAAASKGFSITHYGATTGTALFDLMLEMHDVAEGAWLHLQYKTDLFDASTIERMAGHYVTLLNDIERDADRPIHSLRLLTDDEERLLREWNDAEGAPLDDACFHHVFEAQARQSPSAIAVIAETNKITYSELNARANRLGRHLQSLGVGPESLVGLCMERSIDMIVALLGILKAGGAYVPLDPAYPRERLEFMLEDARVNVLITQERLVDSLPAHRAHLVIIDQGWGEIAGYSGEDVRSGVSSANLAYVIYTSGSTGKPKGTALEHRGLHNLFMSQRRSIAVRPDDRVLQFASLSFDVSIWEISITLTSGAALVVVPKDATRPGPDLIDTLQRYGVTLAMLPPSILSVLPEGSERALPALRTLVTGGEACFRPIIARWAPERRFFNSYGPTEATVFATECACASDDPTVSIGVPILNMSCFILDAWMQPVPIGAPGDLYIGGPGLARCYINRPDITAEKFVPNPFCDAPGERMYKTGDTARYLADGRIEFLGRTDHQVKVRGFRIELGEVEAVLREHADVQDAAAIVVGDAIAERRLAGFVVARGSRRDLTEAELKRWLHGKVPDYLVPASIAVLPSLPLTPSGKVDRRALADAAVIKDSASAGAINGDTERIIALIWEKVLRLNRVGPNDNFFDRGGNSLLITQVHSALASALNRDDIPMVDLFQFPTIRSLAGRLDRTPPAASTFTQVHDRARKQRDAIRRQSLRMQSKKRGDNE
jgi:amino acid adenylation domain-containing protein